MLLAVVSVPLAVVSACLAKQTPCFLHVVARQHAFVLQAHVAHVYALCDGPDEAFRESVEFQHRVVSIEELLLEVVARRAPLVLLENHRLEVVRRLKPLVLELHALYTTPNITKLEQRLGLAFAELLDFQLSKVLPAR